MKKTNTWNSQFIFILAAVGAAAGLGNLWRFPYLTYENGGGAFLVVYLLCLFLIAKPLMMMEIALGQKSKKEIVESLEDKAGKFGRFVGWFAIMILLALAGYYASIIGWGFSFLVASPTIEWGNNAQEFFHQNILTLTDSAQTIGGISKYLVLGIFATYLAVYFSIFRGLKSVSNVVKWTVPLPFLLLFILFLNTSTLEGAMDGFKYFLTPDWAKLGSVKLWKDAASMALFSTNVGLVLTYAYSTFNHNKNDIVKSAWWIGIGDMLVSLTAGLAMFGSLGYMAHQKGIAISEVVESGPTLAFVTIPTALASFPFFPGLFATIFFLAILTLAIDSMFAIVETISLTLKNQFGFFKKLKNKKRVEIICILLFFWSLAFATGNGLYRLDVMDHFFFSHLFYIGVVLQIIVIAWIYGAEKIRKTINETSKFKVGIWFDLLIKFFAPLVFIYLYASTLPKELSENYGGYSTEFLFNWGYLPMILAFVFSFIFTLKDTKK